LQNRAIHKNIWKNIKQLLKTVIFKKKSKFILINTAVLILIIAYSILSFIIKSLKKEAYNFIYAQIAKKGNYLESDLV